MPTFDGTTKLVTLDAGVTSVSVDAIYSDWKEWVKLSDNAKYLPLFRVVGGDPLGSGLFAGTYFFLRNDYGWKIRPPEQDIVITITGNLFSQDSAVGIFLSTLGDFNTSIRLQTSSLTQGISTSGGGNANVDIGAIADAVAARFSFTGGRVDANVDGIANATIDTDKLSKQINRSVQAAIPSPPSSQAIWDAAPKWLKKPTKTKDYSDEIRTLSNKLDGLYQSIQEAKLNVASPATEAFDSSGIEREIQSIAERIEAIEIPDSEEGFASLRGMGEQLKAQLDDVQIAVLGVRKDVSDIPTVIPEPDLTSLATKEELAAIKSLLGKLSNYDDKKVLSLITELNKSNAGLGNMTSVIDQKINLVLDNQLI